MAETVEQRDTEHDEFVQRVARIQDTAASIGWTLLIDSVNEKRAALQNKLAFGGCKDFSDYEKTVAYLDGIKFVLDMPDVLQAKVNARRQQRAEDRQAAEEEADE
jgi:hypothetical protein